MDLKVAMNFNRKDEMNMTLLKKVKNTIQEVGYNVKNDKNVHPYLKAAHVSLGVT